ncbi:MAG: SDR family NAD(P)-dependent oxidoreductase [Betaproteobacteria bacterium]
MNRIDLQGRVAVVTGGARGIGRAIVERFLASGARVAIWDMDVARMQQTVRELTASGNSDAVIGCDADITSEMSLRAALDATVAKFAKVDILINNAGIGGPNTTTWEYPTVEFRRVIEVDLVGVFIGCKVVVPHMIANGYGRIVNIASVAGKEGNPNAPAYSAAKAGVIGLTKSLGKELAQTGVLCNCITPAVALTEILAQGSEEHKQYMLAKIPMGRFLEVDEIGAIVAWLSSEDCSFTTGSVIDITGGRATY